MHNNYIKDLLGFKDVIVKKVTTDKEIVWIEIKTKQKEVPCPCCSNLTSKIHDYRTQIIKDAPIHFKKTYLILRKRRYVCKSCGKKFFEDLEFLPKFYRMTSRLSCWIYDQLLSTTPISKIATTANVSSNTVFRILALFNVTNRSLSEVLSIDEFKGNTGDSKYQVALLDNISGRVLDILPSRKVHDLCEYFKKFSLEERRKVKFFVTDLWDDYKGIAMTYFPNAKVVADRFHFVRYACKALDDARIRVQKNVPKNTRKYIKGSKKLLLARPFNLNTKGLEKVNYILNNFHDDLRTSYIFKEQLLDIAKLRSPALAKKLFAEWIANAETSHIPELVACAKTYLNWSTEICNSFEVPFSNGVIEGTNNKIKVLKRMAFGFRNFFNFRTRILLCTK